MSTDNVSNFELVTNRVPSQKLEVESVTTLQALDRETSVMI